MIVDTHCHLDFFPPSQRSAIIRRSLARLRGLITVGVGIASSRASLAIAASEERIKVVIGLYPHQSREDWSLNSRVSNQWRGELQALEELLNHYQGQISGLGEIGLDYTSPSPSEIDRGREGQKLLLHKQLKLAQKYNLAVVFHCRQAWDDLISLIRETAPPRGVIHCFSFSRKEAREALDLGLNLSFTGMVTFKKNQELRAVLKFVPLSAILLETDAPFLAPEPYRGRTCEPWMVEETLKLVARLKRKKLEEVATQLNENTQHFFAPEGDKFLW